MTTLHRLLAAFMPRTPRAGEKWLALTMVAWGAWLLLPFSTFTAGLATTLLARTMSEDAWGMFGVVLGVLALAASFAPAPRARVVMSLALTFMWFFLAGVTISVSFATAGVLYLMLGLHQAIYIYSNILDWRGDELWKT